MGIESLDQKIAKQQEKLNQLKAQKQAALAREKAKQKAQERKDDTRRKILLGSFLMKQMEDEAQKQKILAEIIVTESYLDCDFLISANLRFLSSRCALSPLLIGCSGFFAASFCNLWTSLRTSIISFLVMTKSSFL